MLTDPQLVAQDMIKTVHHPTAGPLNVLGVPIKLSETPGAVVHPPPRLGEHTTAVLDGMLGVARDDVARLHRDAVIGVAPPIPAMP